MGLTLSDFSTALHNQAFVWLPARSIVFDAVQKRGALHPSGEVIQLSGRCPWQTHLEEIEDTLGMTDHIKFVLYEDSGGGWRVQCVGKRGSAFQNRLSLLEEWRGVRDDALSTLSGIPGCVFVHSAGFIGLKTSLPPSLRPFAFAISYANLIPGFISILAHEYG